MPVTTTPYTREMVMIHRVFRREAAQLRRFVSTTGTGDVARARRLGQWTREYIGGLHHHHALDAALADVTARLGAREETAGETERDLMADSVADHQRVLLEHLLDEEQQQQSPGRVLWKVFGQRQYRRRVAALRGGTR
ncbi:hypothetical protein [Actinoplanes philippinensis]|uniref:hypothetical protein n=1 Tax=Actinoplanes philippinensis TaxID=35752 RepID=UPI0034001506